MKKSILALGLAAAFGTAIAADVDVYGTVDVGLHFDSATVGSNRGKAERTTDRFGLDSGNLASSKFGLKGVEELGNGIKVSFILENGFQADSGKMKGSNDELFDRQATLTMEGAAGKITFGRAGVFASTTGSFDLFNATADAMDGGYGNVIGSNLWAERGVFNNLITYQTPSFGGLQLHVQYSTATDDQEKADSHLNTRYAGAAATYQNGKLGLVFVADTLKRKDVGGFSPEDEKSFSIGANYDFDYFHPFVGVQTTRHGHFTGRLLDRDANGVAVDYKMQDASGYAITAGTKVALRCGRLQLSANYGSAEDTKDQDMKLYSVGMMHQYPLSARTTFYSGLGFQKATLDLASGVDRTTRSYEVMTGLRHSF